MDEVVEQFKIVYNEKGPSDHLSQVPYLAKIGDHYQANDDWPSLLRVSAF